MAVSHLKEFLNGNPWSSAMLFNLLLVILEKLVENDFVCPCRSGYTQAFFALYFTMPMLIAFMFGFYLLNQVFWSDLEHQSLAPGNKDCSVKKCKILFFKGLCLFTPPIVWVTLFFGDGRYVACLNTEIKGKSADSTQLPPWEWCSKDRNLTDSQRYARESFYISKVSGFGSLFLIFILLLIVLLCKRSDKQVQPVAKRRRPLHLLLHPPHRPLLRRPLNPKHPRQLQSTRLKPLHRSPRMRPLLLDPRRSRNPPRPVDLYLLGLTHRKSRMVFLRNIEF